MSLFDTGADQTPKFEDLVGEGKKYKTNDDAVKALLEKDRFIEQLKSETAELRSTITARPVVDRSQEILDRLEALRKEPVTERAEPAVTERTEVKGLSEDDIRRVWDERERQRSAQANIDKVKAVLVEKFGQNYDKALTSISEKNGLSKKALDDLAAQAPQLVLNLMQGVTAENVFMPPESQHSFTPSAGNNRTRSFYNKMKETDPKKYFSPEVRNQQYKDAMTLGEVFEDV